MNGLVLKYTVRSSCHVQTNSGFVHEGLQWKEILQEHVYNARLTSDNAVNRTLQDLWCNARIMGGVTFVLAGDFRQMVPVVPRGTKADELNA
jgi:hypothetical protein